MPPGLLTCLPRGCVPASVGIPDADDDFLVRLFRIDGVGNVHGETVVAAPVFVELLAVDPDGRLPIDGAEVEQRRWPAQSLGTAKVRRYQRRSGGFMTPDSADSAGKGTRMRSDRSLPKGSSSASLATSNCQRPLRLSQASGEVCGRGTPAGPCRASRPGPAGQERPVGRLPVGRDGRYDKQPGCGGDRAEHLNSIDVDMDASLPWRPGGKRRRRPAGLKVRDGAAGYKGPRFVLLSRAAFRYRPRLFLSFSTSRRGVCVPMAERGRPSRPCCWPRPV